MCWLLMKCWSSSRSEISVVGSSEVTIEERNVNFAFVRHSEIVGMSITLGWCITAFVTPLVRPSQLLIFLVHWDYTFLMLESGMIERNEIRISEESHSLYSPRRGDVSRLSSFSRKEIVNLLPDSLDVADSVWQRVCPKRACRDIPRP